MAVTTFMLRTVLFTTTLAIAFFLVERVAAVSWLHPQWKAMLVFFLAVSFLLHRLMELGSQNNREKYVQFYMATIVARLLLSVAFVGFFLYRRVEHTPVFVVNFLVLYVFYTGFEIYGLSRKLRRDS